MKYKTLLFTLLFPCFIFAQAPKVDSLAVTVLNRMSDIIGGLESCSYSLDVSLDKPSEYGLEKHFNQNEVYMKGPDKMLIQSKGNDFHKGFWYNGKEMVYYSYTENNFSVIEAPDDIIKTIDTIHTNYGIDFPAADFFYPAFTDDLLADFKTVVFLGTQKITGKDCYHILADNDKLSVQIWISDDALTLPVKFAIIYKDQKNNPQYEATFSNWQINPNLPDILFDFTPPPAARQISIVPKTTTP